MQKKDNLIKELIENGWSLEPVGYYKTSQDSHAVNKQILGHLLFIRKKKIEEFCEKLFNRSSKKSPQTSINTEKLILGSDSNMGYPILDIDPDPEKISEGIFDDRKTLFLSQQPETSLENNAHSSHCNNKVASLIDKNSKCLPEITHFSNFPSLSQIRRKNPSILIGYDSEWETINGTREMISWQYAVIWDEHLWEFCFLKDGDENLNFHTAIGCILDHLGMKPIQERTVKRYEYCIDFVDGKPVTVITKNLKEAQKNCKYIYLNGNFENIKIEHLVNTRSSRNKKSFSFFHTFYDFDSVERIPVTIVCHAGKVDLSALSYENGRELIKFLTDVHGGVVTLKSVFIDTKSLKEPNNVSLYPIQLSVADTMCHAPSGKKKLADLGAVVGVKKISISTENKSHMLKFLHDKPLEYLEYASTDSVVALMYASAMYGCNKELPATITAASAKVLKNRMMKELGCSSTAEFDRKYRGLQKVSHGLATTEDQLTYLENSSMEPISNDAHSVQHYASMAYHGGYNVCSEVGHFPFDTHDFDLENAYPTAMCLVPDIDWENPIQREIIRRDISLSDFRAMGRELPIQPFVGYVRFEFPKSIKYPCIPVNVEGVPVYPRTSEGMDGVYVAGPFVWLALKLGASVWCERGYFLNTLFDEKHNCESRSIAYAVKQMVVDRDSAKNEHGKGSLEDLVLKEMVNSGYGKNAQNVIEKRAWTAYKNAMESLGCSAITNPVSAMMTTAIVQTELLATQNQLQESGFGTYSVTTDGFITNCPEDTLNSLDMYGLKPFIEQARAFLVGSTRVWSEKHHQNDLVNFTTRGNVSLLATGVCAHNGAKSGYESDSYEDRLWLMTQVLSRTGRIKYTTDEWPTFREIVLGADFVVRQVTRQIRMDFDMKRKPVPESFTTDQPIIEGIAYEIAHFDTVPFDTVKEFLLYREKKALCEVLRTKSDWEKFFHKINLKIADCKAKVRDMDWSILNSCIMGHRAGKWTIPGLETGNVEEKCDWINQFNKSKKKFNVNDWKNARRPDRQANMLPKEFLSELLKEMMCYS